MTLKFTPKYPVGTIVWQVNQNSRKVVGFKVAKISLSFDENFEVDEKKVFYLKSDNSYLNTLDECFLNKKDAECVLEKYIIDSIDDDILYFNSQVTYIRELIHGQQQEFAHRLQSLQDYQKKIKTANKKKRKLAEKKVAKVEKV